MSEKTTIRSAAISGTIALGGELIVNRLGFGAMHLTGDGIWGQPKDPATRFLRVTKQRYIVAILNDSENLKLVHCQWRQDATGDMRFNETNPTSTFSSTLTFG